MAQQQRTALTQRLTDMLVGKGGSSLSGRMRERRWRVVLETFPDLPQMKVLDIGGETAFWRNRSVHPAHVTMINLAPQPADESWIDAIEGDGCALPPDLGTFDLAFSNSVIEHVGGHWRRERFAEGVRNAAPRYWVQTPYRYFPIEPHFVFPFFQHLPRSVQARIAVASPVGNYRAVTNPDVALRAALVIELLSVTEMHHYFPDATIRRERFLGLTKSLIAVKT
jgi:hypothetical protein